MQMEKALGILSETILSENKAVSSYTTKSINLDNSLNPECLQTYQEVRISQGMFGAFKVRERNN